MIKVQHIDHVAITVSDMAHSIDWYAKTLGLEHSSPWDGDPQMMCAGDTCVALFTGDDDAKRSSDADKRQLLTMQHLAFRVDRANFERAQDEFRKQGTEFRFADHGSAHSVYVSDPDGHTIELTTYDV